MKVKDFVFLGIMTVVGFIIYMVSFMASSIFGTFGHTISPGIMGLVGGVWFIFLCYKLGKFPMMTIYTILMMLIMSTMSGFYLPWFVTALATAIVADLLLRLMGFDNIIAQSIGWGLMQLGQASGMWIPIWFFRDSFIETWTSTGRSGEEIANTLKYATGTWDAIAVVLVFVLSIIGIIVGRAILTKYFKKGKYAVDND